MVHGEGNHDSAVSLQKNEQEEADVEGLRDEVRWALSTVDPHAAPALSPTARDFVESELQGWVGERMPLSRSWVEEPLEEYRGVERDVARLALLTVKAPYQVGDEVVLPVLESEGEEGLIKVLAWSGMTATRHLTELSAERVA